MYVNSNKRSRNFCLKNSNCNITTETYETVYLFLIHMWIGLISGGNNSAIYIFPSSFRPLFWSTHKENNLLGRDQIFPKQILSCNSRHFERALPARKANRKSQDFVKIAESSVSLSWEANRIGRKIAMYNLRPFIYVPTHLFFLHN